MDEIVKKVASIGFPEVILVIITVASEGSSAGIAATLTTLGRLFGIVRGIPSLNQ
ncbi:MAG: hypothetical protein KME46_19110 [Brasilonema angustatum HA4187-MV1]|nr:hypothetical protein [Brasilonema angustatum HA4187-MV1]